MGTESFGLTDLSDVLCEECANNINYKYNVNGDVGYPLYMGNVGKNDTGELLAVENEKNSSNCPEEILAVKSETSGSEDRNEIEELIAAESKTSNSDTKNDIKKLIAAENKASNSDTKVGVENPLAVKDKASDSDTKVGVEKSSVVKDKASDSDTKVGVENPLVVKDKASDSDTKVGVENPLAVKDKASDSDTKVGVEKSSVVKDKASDSDTKVGVENPLVVKDKASDSDTKVGVEKSSAVKNEKDDAIKGVSEQQLSSKLALNANDPTHLVKQDKVTNDITSSNNGNKNATSDLGNDPSKQSKSDEDSEETPSLVDSIPGGRYALNLGLYTLDIGLDWAQTLLREIKNVILKTAAGAIVFNSPIGTGCGDTLAAIPSVNPEGAKNAFQNKNMTNALEDTVTVAVKNTVPKAIKEAMDSSSTRSSTNT